MMRNACIRAGRWRSVIGQRVARIFLIGLLACPNILLADEQTPLIAAASDLEFALAEVIESYRQQSGVVVRASYGSSGNIFSQIQQGAPFDIFMSADETLVFQLAERGVARDQGQIYGIGRLAFYVPHGSALRADESLDDLRQALTDGRIKHFAIANPEHAPYGRAAREALQARGLWQDIESRLVLGENVAQAAQFVLSGAAEGGIIALSLASAPAFRAAGEFVVLPESLHQPLRQRAVLLASAKPAAHAIYEFLNGAVARAIFARHGFTLPEQ
jgi:molybdate transport system substrate-binding protein